MSELATHRVRASSADSHTPLSAGVSTLGDERWELPTFTVDSFFPRRRKYAIVIPVLNEGDRIRSQLKRMSQLTLSGVVDIIIADGGSTDGAVSPDFLKSVGVRALLTKTGSGKLSAQLRMALAWGLREGYAGHVLVDGNNKDSIEDVPKFVTALEAGHDHVQGSRYLPGGVHENTPLTRALGIRLLHAPLISLAARVRYTDTTNGFKAYSNRFLLDPRVQPFRALFDTYELHSYLAIRAGQVGMKVSEIAVQRKYPSKGPTPTKISRWRGSFLMLGILFSACLGRYSPKG